MAYKKSSHPDDLAFASHSQGADTEKDMSYYQWLVGQLAQNPVFIAYPLSVYETADEITDNIIKIADKLIEKMEKRKK